MRCTAGSSLGAAQRRDGARVARHGRRSTRIGRGPVVLGVVMLVAVACTVGAIRILSADETGTPSCSAAVGTLHIGADAALVPWLGELAASYTGARRAVR